VPAKKIDPWVLREEKVTPEQEILEEFYETKTPRKKIIHAAKLIELAIKDEDIKEDMPRIYKELTACLAEPKQLSPGERLFGIWIRNDLARNLHEDVDTLEPTSGSIILASTDLSELATQIPSTHFKRFINLIERTKGDAWARDVFDLLKNSSGKLTAECINYLIDKGLEAEITATLERWLVEQNLKAPVLSWILRNRNSRKYGDMLKPLINPRLMGAIFFAIDYEALQNTGTRRIPLSEQVSEDTAIISDLLATASYENAHDLAQTLMLNQGFEDLSKKSLLARFIRLFPAVQAVVGGETPVNAQAGGDDALIVSKSSFEARKVEYDRLVGEQIPRNKLDIAEARAHGDLRENAEYKMARQEQDLLMARRGELEVAMRNARITDFSDAPTDFVGIGSVVDIEASSGQAVTYTILGAWDGDPEAHVISYQTPLARALIGRRIGDQVPVDIDGHTESWVVRDIRRFVDAG
jgi:transcription elongation GreA/GreB family factor